MKKGDHGAFDPTIFPTAVTPNGTRVHTLLVVSPTRRNSRILEAGRRRSEPASCGSLVRTVLVADLCPLTARMKWSSSTTCCDTGGRCGRQGRRKSEVVATVVASTTVAVAAASLGDFAVAAAAVKLEDVAGSRRRAVVARGVGGGAIGACVGVLAGWRWGQLGRRKAVVAPMKSVGVGRNLMEMYRTKSRRQRSFGCRPV